MIEPLLFDLRVLPVRRVVAIGAGGSEAALVHVFVAGDALRRKAEERPAQVLLQLLQKSARRRLDIFRLVALPAIDGRMFAVQHVARLRVIESLVGRLPVQQGEVLAVVVGVALDARLARPPRIRIGAVQAAVLLQLRRDLRDGSRHT